MKIFISWSGDRSKAIAEALKLFLKRTLQATQPWLSSDIEKGSVWFNQISAELTANVGIICLTPENLDARWILFEAGALAKGLEKSRVCTLLNEVAETDVKPPLSLFHFTKSTKADLLNLFAQINGWLEESQRLEKSDLDAAFNAFWPQFETDWKKAMQIKVNASKPSTRPPEDVQREILETVREIQRRLTDSPSPFEVVVEETPQSISHWLRSQQSKNEKLNDKEELRRILEMVSAKQAEAEVSAKTFAEFVNKAAQYKAPTQMPTILPNPGST